MLGFSAGAMLMSKYIIITPCSEEYPNTLVVGDEVYQKEDLEKVSKEYGIYYLLQDHVREDGLTDVSLIKSTNGNIEFYTENNGKIWTSEPNSITLIYKNNINPKKCTKKA